jgi:D-alanyl-D-alanine carboxypeptidase/D-alanyl-D-alanine-endopeptidase (penicillin-binding protein 4)
MQPVFTALVVAVFVLSRAFAAGTDELPPTVRSVLELRELPPDTLSIYVEDLGTGEPLLRWLDQAPRNPASTIKLLTTLVALDLLGPAYTWNTNIYALGDIDGDTLEGDLLIQGNGDPFLVTERVWQMLRRVRQTGIRVITGDLLIDDSYFDVAAEDPAAFDRQPLRAYNVTPNALLMNFKVVRFWFEPDHGANAVRVRLDPPLTNVDLVNELSLADGRCRGYQRGITISTNAAIDKVTFSGKFPNGCKRYAMDRTALSHNEFAFGLFSLLWRESGGGFDGRLRNARTPDDVEPLVTFESLPLVDVIARVNKHSNNVMARQLLYTLSAEQFGAPGTEAGGRKVVSDWLTQNGLNFAELAFENGAGRSRDVRISARDLGAMLAFAWRQTYMPEYVSSLALSGSDGTLRRRLDDQALVGRAHLKTGSLDHVAAIAGYLQSRSGRRFVVVVLQNHLDVHRGPGEEVQEALLRWLNRQ